MNVSNQRDEFVKDFLVSHEKVHDATLCMVLYL